MLKTLKCWGMRKLGECYQFVVDRTEEDIRIANLCLSNISTLQSELEKCIGQNNVEEVLRFEGEYINHGYFYDIQEKEFDRKLSAGEDIVNFSKEPSSCKSTPDACNTNLKMQEKVFEGLIDEVNKRIQRYNMDLTVIKKVHNYCFNYEDRELLTESVYFKFGRDKQNDLICLYFNIDSFVKDDSYSPIETVHVFSGLGESPFDYQTVLHLKYESNGYSLWGTDVYEKVENNPQAHICDFLSFNCRRGHATFLIKHLEELIHEINKRIISFRDQDGEQLYNRRKPITAINGEVFPGSQISYEDLVGFYNKNGFPTLGRRYEDGGFAANRVIYKTIALYKVLQNTRPTGGYNIKFNRTGT